MNEDILTRCDMLTQSDYFTRIKNKFDRELDQFHDANKDVAWLIATVRSLLGGQVGKGSREDASGAVRALNEDFVGPLQKMIDDLDAASDLSNRRPKLGWTRRDYTKNYDFLRKLRDHVEDLERRCNVKELENAELRSRINDLQSHLGGAMGLLKNVCDGNEEPFDIHQDPRCTKLLYAVVPDYQPEDLASGSTLWQPIETARLEHERQQYEAEMHEQDRQRYLEENLEGVL